MIFLTSSLLQVEKFLYFDDGIHVAVMDLNFLEKGPNEPPTLKIEGLRTK